MFTVSLTEPLKDGFYALHFGDLSNQLNSDSPGKVAYDFVVGMTNRVYQPVSDDPFSNEDLLGVDASDTTEIMNEGTVVAVEEVIAEQEFLDKARELLQSVNACFNAKNYVELRKLYLNPDKSIINDIDWNKLESGFRNWSSKAGNVKSSSVVSLKYYCNDGTLVLQTIYDKMGSVYEYMDVVAIDKKYYLTFIGAR